MRPHRTGLVANRHSRAMCSARHRAGAWPRATCRVRRMAPPCCRPLPARARRCAPAGDVPCSRSRAGAPVRFRSDNRADMKACRARNSCQARGGVAVDATALMLALAGAAILVVPSAALARPCSDIPVIIDGEHWMSTRATVLESSARSPCARARQIATRRRTPACAVSAALSDHEADADQGLDRVRVGDHVDSCRSSSSGNLSGVLDQHVHRSGAPLLRLDDEAIKLARVLIGGEPHREPDSRAVAFRHAHESARPEARSLPGARATPSDTWARPRKLAVDASNAARSSGRTACTVTDKPPRRGIAHGAQCVDERRFSTWMPAASVRRNCARRPRPPGGRCPRRARAPEHTREITSVARRE